MSALHRPNAATPFCRPEMWVARSPDMIHWGRHECLHGGGAEMGDRPRRCRHAAGAGSGGLAGDLPRQPPADHGPARWASTPPASCCSTRRTRPGSSAARADSIFEPTAEFERHGFVPDVVFPTGIVETEDTFLVYYGAADTCTAVVEFAREELMATLIAL